MFSERTFLRLDLLRFPLIVGVVFIHAYENWVEMAGQVVGVTGIAPVADFVRNAISQGVARLSVPMLFLMSGYLFFREGKITKSDYFRKMRARIPKLVLPMIYWNAFTLLVIFFLQSIPYTASFFSGRNTSIAEYSLYDVAAAIWGIGRAPIAHQFWFVRDLIILLLLAPVFGLLMRICPWFVLTLFSMCWFLDWWPVAAPTAEATFFVFIGYFLAFTQRDIFSLDRYGRPATIAYAILLIIDAQFYGTSIGKQVHSLSVPFGIIALLYFSGMAIDCTPRFAAALISLSGASFFVFAAHDPLLTAVRKLVFRLVEPDSEISLLMLYIAAPISVTVSLVVLHRALYRLVPRFALAVSGGR